MVASRLMDGKFPVDAAGRYAATGAGAAAPLLRPGYHGRIYLMQRSVIELQCSAACDGVLEQTLSGMYRKPAHPRSLFWGRGGSDPVGGAHLIGTGSAIPDGLAKKGQN